MDPIQALAMGVVQGLTEILPISSSAHLVLLPWVFGWSDPGLTFDVALHLGTLIAVVAFFWRDWVGLIGGFWRTLTARRKVDDREARLFWLVVFASVPGAIAGAALESQAESAFRAPLVVAGLMIGLGIVLMVAEYVSTQTKLLEHVGIGDSAWIGIAQALAIMPGVSRSGITISAGMFRGFTREAAARFSFLMSTPIIAGAALFQLRHLLGGIPANEQMAFIVGVATSAVVGYLAIRLMLSYVQHHSLRVFAYYRFAIGVGIVLLLLTGTR